jgi:hypothetical protein
MLKAASLFYATVIALIIAILSSSLLLFSFFKQQERILYLRQESVCRNVVSGIRLIMAEDSLWPEGQKKIVDLFGNNSDSVSLQAYTWGGYRVALCVAYSGNKRNSKAILFGAVPDSTVRTAMYITDNGKPITLCGKTVIRGLCYLPEAGVKRGYIEGKNYEGDELIKGEVKKSDKQMPGLPKSIIQHLHAIFSKKAYALDSVVNCNGIITKDSLTNSFFNKSLRLYSHSNITIDANAYLSGNIKIISDTQIVVKSGCVMKDVILIAPIVRIQDEFNGDLQIFAIDSIVIGKNCILNYPSVLAISKQRIGANNSAIIIGEKCKVTGNLFAYNEMSATRKQIIININKYDTVNGMVYTNGDVDIKGVVYGNITCNQLSLKTASSEYEGYLMDATIDITKLSNYFVGADFVTSKHKSIAKWVN